MFSQCFTGVETRETNAKGKSFFREFEGRRSRRILKIKWKQRVTGVEIIQMTRINISDGVRNGWGICLEYRKMRHQYAALKWNKRGQNNSVKLEKNDRKRDGRSW